MSLPTLYAPAEQGFTEQIRMLFAETGVKYDDIISDAAAMDKKGELNFHKLPKLVWTDGFALCESAAIMEHIAVQADAAKAGRGNSYLGGNEMERSMARALCQASNDLRRELYEMYLKPGPLQDQDKFVSTTLPHWLQHLNKLAVETESNDHGLGPGVHYTFGDVAMFDALTQLRQAFGEDVLNEYRELKAYYDKTGIRARLRMFLDNRPSRPLRQ